MALFWRRVALTSTVSVEEAQKRLAAAMEEWGCYHRGRSPQPLPWPDGRFLACPPTSFWSNTALVVDGIVQARDGATQVTAVIRPRGLAFASPFILSAIILAVAARESDPARMLVPLALLWVVVPLFLWPHVARNAPAVEVTLAAALRFQP